MKRKLLFINFIICSVLLGGRVVVIVIVCVANDILGMILETI